MIMRDEMAPCFREQLIDLWDGKLFQQREVVNYALDGTKLNLLLQFSYSRPRAGLVAGAVR